MPVAPPVWLRGPLPGIHPTLQPAAHAILQVAEETPEVIAVLSHEQVWQRLGQSASIGFHIIHLCGSLDRLLTYARAEGLSPVQQEALAAEKTVQERRPPVAEVLGLLASTTARAMEQLRSTDPATLYDAREVGRAKLPSNVIGLLFHAAEHTGRHGGQVITLVRIIHGK